MYFLYKSKAEFVICGEISTDHLAISYHKNINSQLKCQFPNWVFQHQLVLALY